MKKVLIGTILVLAACDGGTQCWLEDSELHCDQDSVVLLPEQNDNDSVVCLDEETGEVYSCEE